MTKNRFKGILIFIFIFIVSTGCERQIKDYPNNGITKMKDDQINPAEESLKWPKEVMQNIPNFKGVLSKSWQEGNQGSMVFVDVKRDEADQYIQVLAESGFKKELVLNDQEIFLYAASREENKEKITLTFIEKEKELLISYLKQK